MAEQSIQELVKNPIHEIPKRYLVNEETSISLEDNSFAVIPTIDMQNFVSSGPSKIFELEKLHSTCKEWGIFQLVNHGVDSSLVEKLKYEIQEFYKLPLEERLKYKVNEGDFEGYGQTIIHSEDQKVDWADRFYMIVNPINRRKPHLLPELPSSLRETLEDYMSNLQKLSMNLFVLLAEALNIERTEVEEMFDDGMQAVRITYYPPCLRPEKVIGLTPHSDGSGLTILLQVNGVEGLQVKKDGVWMPVKFLPDAFVVNLGDILEILSNGLYSSIEHRATVNAVKERISMAMFFNTKYEAEVGPSRSLITTQQPIYKRMKMETYVKEFFSRKLNGKAFLEYMKIQQND
ncbi:codeine O-demethylase-like [Olea europaea var. sylvestris]|uniref:SRG1 n=1 Tax=Olea europaea subsp. europaea TaxID=158383 RepID=A0A8S0V8U5_OLEEU|nr:codeine O-demethylase-like [Olea europaea var. sylvestris]CAA3027741.1 SRG1 [Olea europaea subsp. europaea]